MCPRQPPQFIYCEVLTATPRHSTTLPSQFYTNHSCIQCEYYYFAWSLAEILAWKICLWTVKSVFHHMRSARRRCCLAWVTLLFIHGAGLWQLILRDLIGACLFSSKLITCFLSPGASRKRTASIFYFIFIHLWKYKKSTDSFISVICSIIKYIYKIYIY